MLKAYVSNIVKTAINAPDAFIQWSAYSIFTKKKVCYGVINARTTAGQKQLIHTGRSQTLGWTRLVKKKF